MNEDIRMYEDRERKSRPKKLKNPESFGTQIRCPCSYIYPRSLYKEKDLFPLKIKVNKPLSRKSRIDENDEEKGSK